MFANHPEIKIKVWKLCTICKYLRRIRKGDREMKGTWIATSRNVNYNSDGSIEFGQQSKYYPTTFFRNTTPENVSVGLC